MLPACSKGMISNSRSTDQGARLFSPILVGLNVVSEKSRAAGDSCVALGYRFCFQRRCGRSENICDALTSRFRRVRPQPVVTHQHRTGLILLQNRNRVKSLIWRKSSFATYPVLARRWVVFVLTDCDIFPQLHFSPSRLGSSDPAAWCLIETLAAAIASQATEGAIMPDQTLALPAFVALQEFEAAIKLMLLRLQIYGEGGAGGGPHPGLVTQLRTMVEAFHGEVTKLVPPLDCPALIQEVEKFVFTGARLTVAQQTQIEQQLFTCLREKDITVSQYDSAISALTGSKSPEPPRLPKA